MDRDRYEESVFLNVPFDDDFKHIFDALVFAVFDCGFIARSALEDENAMQVRIHKIYKLIEECKYSIHDISCTSLDKKNNLPRFNMPLELGIFLGAKFFGSIQHHSKCGLILDRDRYRYQKYCSDIAGQDIRPHNNNAREAIYNVRDWLRGSPESKGVTLPGKEFIYERYRSFRRQLPKLCTRLDLNVNDLHFNDYRILVTGWLQKNHR